jgi:predicted phosphodiesterase
MTDDLAEIRALQAEADGKDPRLARIEALASELHADGLDFSVVQGRVTMGQRERDGETSIDLGSKHLRLGIVSDPHLGSRYEQLTALRSFYAYADDAKVDAFINAGDIVQGSDKMHKGMELEVHAHGADAQMSYAVAVYPKSRRRSVKTYAIAGNHDDSFLKDGGINVVRRIAAQRPDMVYIGQDAAYLTVSGLRMYVVHPDGGNTYAKSYKPQKLAESLPLEREVALLLIGHYHNYGAFRQKHTISLMLPCFQSQYAWLARKALHPDIGGIVADIWLDDAGRIVRFSHEVIDYRPIDEDWDGAASLVAGRGWAVGVS